MCLALIKASQWGYLMVQCFSLKLEIYMDYTDIDVVKELGSFDRSFGGSNYGNTKGLLLEDSLVSSTSGNILGSDESIKWKLSDDELLGFIIGDIYGITLVIVVETEQGYLGGSLMIQMMSFMRDIVYRLSQIF